MTRTFNEPATPTSDFVELIAYERAVYYHARRDTLSLSHHVSDPSIVRRPPGLQPVDNRLRAMLTERHGRPQRQRRGQHVLGLVSEGAPRLEVGHAGLAALTARHAGTALHAVGRETVWFTAPVHKLICGEGHGASSYFGGSTLIDKAVLDASFDTLTLVLLTEGDGASSVSLLCNY